MKYNCGESKRAKKQSCKEREEPFKLICDKPIQVLRIFKFVATEPDVFLKDVANYVWEEMHNCNVSYSKFSTENSVLYWK